MSIIIMVKHVEWLMSESGCMWTNLCASQYKIHECTQLKLVQVAPYIKNVN